jgi:Fur family transcriptional regulator, peroxide stress response regulator
LRGVSTFTKFFSKNTKIISKVLKRLPTISLDTVYRTLTTLEKHGLIARIQTVSSQARFEAKITVHHHAVCSNCGAITDFIWDSFDTAPVPSELNGWGKITKRNAILEGTCNACSDKAKMY